MAPELLSPTSMNDEEKLLAKDADETEPRTTAPYDSVEIEDDEVTELTDDDILFEVDDRD
ncbi:MAG TPA: hypothetical protein VLT45_28670 [Kofleriaceae bacterium]|nr:hypothetical protein [Kofleriaceae bacterium]